MHSLCSTSMISYQSQWKIHAYQLKTLANEILACKFDVLDHSPLFAIRMLAVMLILYTQCRNSQTKIVMSTSWCQVETVTLTFHSSSFIQVVTGYKYCKVSFILVFFSWSHLSKAVTCAIRCYNQWSPPVHEGFSHGSLKSILCTWQISKFHGHLCSISLAFIEAARSIKVPPTGNIMK